MTNAMDPLVRRKRRLKSCHSAGFCTSSVGLSRSMVERISVTTKAEFSKCMSIATARAEGTTLSSEANAKKVSHHKVLCFATCKERSGARCPRGARHPKPYLSLWLTHRPRIDPTFDSYSSIVTYFLPALEGNSFQVPSS